MDLGGNVAEWCLDDTNVVRGGSWKDGWNDKDVKDLEGANLKTSYREPLDGRWRNDYTGFRIVLKRKPGAAKDPTP